MNKHTMKKFAPKYLKKIENGQCPFCEKPINENEFTDELSKKEYKISGLCQSCQDKVLNTIQSL